MRNINSVFLSVVKKAITNIQTRYEESEDIISIHIKQDFKEDARDDDSSSVYGVVSHYVNTKEIIREIADEIFKLQEAEFIKKDLIMMLLDYSQREIFGQLQLWWEFLSSDVTEEVEDPNKVVVVVDDEPSDKIIYELPEDITHFVFNGEEVPSWFFHEYSFSNYEKLVSIEGKNLKRLYLSLFKYAPNLERVVAPNTELIVSESVFRFFPKLKTLIVSNVGLIDSVNIIKKESREWMIKK